MITRHGKPVAAVVPFDDVERLATYLRSDKRKGLASLFRKMKPADDLVEAALGARELDRRAAPRPVLLSDE